MTHTHQRSIRLLAFLLTTLVALSSAGPALADLRIPFQGRLVDAGPFANGTYKIDVRLYDAESGGALLYSETHAAVPVTDGRVNLIIGSVDPIPASLSPNFEDGGPVYAEFQIDDQLPPLSPRHRLVPAFHASVAGTVLDEGITSDRIAGGAVTGEKITAGAVTAQKLQPGLELAVPLGGIILWQGDLVAPDGNGSFTGLPPGFELCNGDTVITAGPLFGQPKPDLVDKFARGASDDETAGPLPEGGQDAVVASNTAGHALALSELPGHSHAISNFRMSGGAHSHGGSDMSCAALDSGLPLRHSLGDLGANPTLDNTACPLVSGGEHDHFIAGGFTEFGNPAVDEQTPPLGQEHSHGLSAVNNVPAYVGLHFIMRVL